LESKFPIDAGSSTGFVLMGTIYCIHVPAEYVRGPDIIISRKFPSGY
jgi:hypothetical protein